MTYAKEFLEIPQLIEHMRESGLEIGDESLAKDFLLRIGYFRSGGYRYVFRTLLSPEDQDPRTHQFRTDRYMPGATLALVQQLERFDAKLREVCLAGTMDFEVRFRAALAHVLSRRDIYAHTKEEHLNEEVCAQPALEGTKFSAWEKTYREAIKGAKEEDFVAHHLLKYGHPIPIWLTIDLLSLGSLPFLYDLARVEDQREIAAMFGVKQPGVFSAWTRSIADLRNYSAHGSRLFNRQTKRAIKVVPSAIDPALLGHLAQSEFTETPVGPRRLYAVAAVLAYMLHKHASGSNWANTFKTQVRKLPPIRLSKNDPSLLSAARNMGFPADWDALPLWTNA